MADVRVTFDVVDQFTQRMNQFEDRLRALEGASGRVDRNMNRTERSIGDVGGAASKSGGLLKGFGGAMFLVNQAMQAFQKIAETVKSSLDDIADRERAIIMLGPSAGNALSDFARESAHELGRSQSDIMKSALKFRETGMGGQDIMDMTKLADRFANLNQKDYNEVAQTLNDAVKNKNVGGLAELLGGGEGVEKKLQRAGVERALRRGDVSAAMSGFSNVADSFGYTQDNADKMGMTITRKVERITDRVKNKFTDMFSGIVQRAEPYIDRIMDWLDSEEVDIFFDNVGRTISSFIDTVGTAVDWISDTVGGLWDDFHGFYDDIIGDSTSTLETIVGIFVGGITALGGHIYNACVNIWNMILGGTEKVVNGIMALYLQLKGGIDPENAEKYTREAGVAADLAGMSLQMAERAKRLYGEDSEQYKKWMEVAQKGIDRTSEMNKKAKGEIDAYRDQFFDAKRFMGDTIDPDKVAADNIAGVMGFINGFGVDKRDPERKKANKILGDIHRDTAKIRGAMLHEQDLRWLKERAEQHAVNEVNVRQLTPTINVKIEGGNITQRDVEKGIQKVLEEQINAGTFNAYGEVA